MNKILVTLLVFLMLTSQLTMAYGNAAGDPDSQHASSSLSNQQDKESHCGDHCCHASAHFVGLIPQINVLLTVKEHNLGFPAYLDFISIPEYPPTPPPIV